MASFPTFGHGESVHLPFTPGVDFWNVVNRMPHGWQYSYNLLASGVKRWEFELCLSDAELATIKTFWDARKGSYEEFQFTDPDSGVTTTKCRFDQDSLEIRHAGPNENYVPIVIQEYR